MHQESKKELLPVSHYELFGIAHDASEQLILQKYRLLKMFWNVENAKWLHSTSDREPCQLIRLRIEAGYQILSNKLSRAVYDASLVDPVSNEIERNFRLTWDRMRLQYRSHLNCLRVLPLPTEDISYRKQWGGEKGLPKDLLAYLFRWVPRRGSGWLPRVSIESKEVVYGRDLQCYCDFVNEQNTLFSELVTTKIEPLTITNLKNHWPFDDALLRLLVNFRLYPSSGQQNSAWFRSFLLTLDDPAQNSYLKNPYLRDLVILLLSYQVTYRGNQLPHFFSTASQKAAALVPANIVQFSDLRDPSAIFLYANVAKTVPSIQTLFQVVANSILKEKSTDRQYQDIVTLLQEQLYLRPINAISFIIKIINLAEANTEHNPRVRAAGDRLPLRHPIRDRQQVFSQANFFIALPNGGLRQYLLSTDWARFGITLTNLEQLHLSEFDAAFCDHLSVQLKEMTVEEIGQYLSVMHLLDNYVRSSGEFSHSDKSSYLSHLAQLFQEFATLPVKVVKEKLQQVSATNWLQSLRNPAYVLKLLLNARTKHVTLEKITSIFKEKLNYPKDDSEVNNLETFALFLNDECIDYLLDPTNLLRPDDSSSISVFHYLKNLGDSKELGRHLRALRFLCQSDLMSLLTKKYLFLDELSSYSKRQLLVILDILEVIPTEQHSRDLVLRVAATSEAQSHSRWSFEQFLSKHHIKLNTKLELAQLMLLPNSEAIPDSTACAQLIERIGLQHFIIFASKELNFFSMISYLNRVFEKAPEKFPGLLNLIQQAFEANQAEKLPELMNGYLFGLVPAAVKQSDNQEESKRARVVEPTEEDIRRLRQRVETDSNCEAPSANYLGRK